MLLRSDPAPAQPPPSPGTLTFRARRYQRTPSELSVLPIVRYPTAGVVTFSPAGAALLVFQGRCAVFERLLELIEHQALPGKPWSWCLEFPDAFTERCAALALLGKELAGTPSTRSNRSLASAWR